MDKKLDDYAEQDPVSAVARYTEKKVSSLVAVYAWHDRSSTSGSINTNAHFLWIIITVVFWIWANIKLILLRFT